MLYGLHLWSDPFVFSYVAIKYEPRHDKTNKVTVHPAKTQADLRWAHTHFVGFVMSWLIC